MSKKKNHSKSDTSAKNNGNRFIIVTQRHKMRNFYTTIN